MLSLDSTSPGDIVYSEQEQSEFIVSQLVVGTTTGTVSLYLMNLWDKRLKIAETKYKTLEGLLLIRENKEEYPPEHVYNTIQHRLKIISGEQGELKHILNSKEGKTIRSFLFALTEVDANGGSIGEGIKEIIHKIYAVSGSVPTSQEIYNVLRNNISKNVISDEYLRILGNQLGKESYRFKASSNYFKQEITATSAQRMSVVKRGLFSAASTPDNPNFGGFLKVAHKPNPYNYENVSLIVGAIAQNPKKVGEVLKIDFGEQFYNQTPDERFKSFTRKMLERFGALDNLSTQEADSLIHHYLNDSKSSYEQLKYLFHQLDPTGNVHSVEDISGKLSAAKNELGWMMAGIKVGVTDQGSSSKYSLGGVQELEKFSGMDPDSLIGVDKRLLLAYSYTDYNRNVALKSLLGSNERFFLRAEELNDIRDLDIDSPEIKGILDRSSSIAKNAKVVVDPSDPRATVVLDSSGIFKPTSIDYPEVPGKIYPTKKGFFLANEVFNDAKTQKRNFTKGKNLLLDFDFSAGSFTLSRGEKKIMIGSQTETLQKQLQSLEKALSGNSYNVGMTSNTASMVSAVMQEEGGLSKILRDRSFITDNNLREITNFDPKAQTFFLNDSIIGGDFLGKGFNITGVQDIGGTQRILMQDPSKRGSSFHLDLTPEGAQSFLRSLESASSKSVNSVIKERALRIVNNINPFNRESMNLPIFNLGQDNQVNKAATTFRGLSLYWSQSSGIPLPERDLDKLNEDISLSFSEAQSIFPGESHSDELARNLLINSWQDSSKKAIYDEAGSLISSESMEFLQSKLNNPNDYGLAYALMMEQAYKNPITRTYHQPGLGVSVDISSPIKNSGYPNILGKTSKKMSINLETGVSAESSLESLFASIVSSAGSNVSGDYDRVASTLFLKNYGFDDIYGLRDALRTTSTSDYTAKRAESIIRARGLIENSPDLLQTMERALADKGEDSIFNSVVGALKQRKQSVAQTTEEAEMFDLVAEALEASEGGLNDLPSILHSFSGHKSYSVLSRSKESNDPYSIIKNLDNTVSVSSIEDEIAKINGDFSPEEIGEALKEVRDNKSKNSPGVLASNIRERLEHIRSLREVGGIKPEPEAKKLLDLTAKTQELKVLTAESNASDIARDINNLLAITGREASSKKNMQKAAALAALATLSQTVTPSVMLPYTSGPGMDPIQGLDIPRVKHHSVNIKISGNLSRENLNSLKNSVYDTISNSYVISNYINQMTVEQENAMEQRQNFEGNFK